MANENLHRADFVGYQAYHQILTVVIVLAPYVYLKSSSLLSRVVCKGLLYHCVVHLAEECEPLVLRDHTIAICIELRDEVVYYFRSRLLISRLR